MSDIRPWSILLVALSLSGCGGLVVVNDAMEQPNYIDREEEYAARNGAIRVEVNGSTFGLTREQFASEVVKRIRASYYRHEFFALEASSATDTGYRVIMMFDPDPGVSGNRLCAASQPLQPVQRVSEELTSLFVAFCGGSRSISESEGRVIGGVRGIEDSNFTALIARTVNTLFPKGDFRHNSGGDF